MSAQYDFEYFLSKCRSFCSYRERCLSEVKSKLNSWHIKHSVAEKIIKTLKEEDILNEERYCMSFTRGKFRINKWGKNRIMHELSRKEIPDLMIQISLSEIHDKEYYKTAKKLIKNKYKELRRKDKRVPKGKIASYMINKGFEPEIIWKEIHLLYK